MSELSGVMHNQPGTDHTSIPHPLVPGPQEEQAVSTGIGCVFSNSDIYRKIEREIRSVVALEDYPSDRRLPIIMHEFENSPALLDSVLTWSRETNIDQHLSYLDHGCSSIVFAFGENYVFTVSTATETAVIAELDGQLPPQMIQPIWWKDFAVEGNRSQARVVLFPRLEKFGPLPCDAPRTMENDPFKRRNLLSKALNPQGWRLYDTGTDNSMFFAGDPLKTPICNDPGAYLRPKEMPREDSISDGVEFEGLVYFWKGLQEEFVPVLGNPDPEQRLQLVLSEVLGK